MDKATERAIGQSFGAIYSDDPGYYELIYDSYQVIKMYYGTGQYWENYKGVTTGLMDEFKKYYSFDNKNFIPIFLISIVFTVVRYAFNRVISDVSINIECFIFCWFNRSLSLNMTFLPPLLENSFRIRKGYLITEVSIHFSYETI